MPPWIPRPGPTGGQDRLKAKLRASLGSTQSALPRTVGVWRRLRALSLGPLTWSTGSMTAPASSIEIQGCQGQGMRLAVTQQEMNPMDRRFLVWGRKKKPFLLQNEISSGAAGRASVAGEQLREPGTTRGCPKRRREDAEVRAEAGRADQPHRHRGALEHNCKTHWGQELVQMQIPGTQPQTF